MPIKITQFKEAIDTKDIEMFKKLFEREGHSEGLPTNLMLYAAEQGVASIGRVSY